MLPPRLEQPLDPSESSLLRGGYAGLARYASVLWPALIGLVAHAHAAGPSAAHAAGPGATHAAGPGAEPNGQQTTPALPKSDLALAARYEVHAGGTPRGLLACDLDGTGPDELVAVLDSPGRLVLWHGLSANFGAPVRAAQVEIGEFSLGPLVIETSSGPELVVAGRGDRSLRRLVPRLDESGEWQFEQEQVELPRVPRALTVIPATSSNGPVVVVALEGGQLSCFEPATNGSDVWRATGGAMLGDRLATCATFLPGCGWLAVGCQAGPSVRLLQQLEDGSWIEHKHQSLPGIPRAIRAKLDPDGRERIWVAGGDREVWTWDPTGDQAPASQAAGALPIDLEIRDVDRDGRDDVLVLHHGDGRLTVRQEREGGQAPLVRNLYAGPMPWSVTSGDLDGDGQADVAVADAAAGAISIYFGAETGWWANEDQAATPAPHSMAVGDLDGDGRPEVGVLSALDNRLVILGKGQALQALDVPPESDALNFGDVDGDGRLDAVLITAGDGGAAVAVAWGNGAGQVGGERGVARLALDGQPFDAALSDVNGDGRQEVLVSDAAGGRLWIVECQGSGDLRVRAEFDAGVGAGPLCAVERDGRFIGVALGLRDVSQRFGLALLLPSDPSRPFDLQQVGFLQLPRAPEDVVAADFDGDGRPDVAALMPGFSDNSPGSILAGLSPQAEGQGFAMQIEMATGPKPFHLAAGDLDGDGCAELFATSQYANRLSTWVGRKDRQRALVPGVNLGAHRGCMNVEVADMNGDGRLDVIVGNNHSGDISLLLAR